MPRRVPFHTAARALALALLALVPAGCASRGAPPTRFIWVVGQGCPSFDPQGPPDPVRWALERLRSRGLVERDSAGHIVPMAADRFEVTPDSLTWTFHLREGLAFTDGTPCTSADFERAIRAGLARRDHSTVRWLLGAVAGLDRARPGHAPAPIGVATPDPRTLVLRLARPDRRLLDALALPGVAVPWRAPPSSHDWAVGLGPYAPVSVSESRWTLARSRHAAWLTGPRGAIADSVQVRFVVGAGRLHVLLRAGVPDLAWPLPPGLLDLPRPPGYQVVGRDPTPPRRLLLVMRADLPPTSKPAARQVLAHGLNRADVAAHLGALGGAPSAWLVGGTPFDFPVRSEEEVRGWLERGKLGRSMHVVLVYSADGVAGEVVRDLQIGWATLGLDVELQPVRATAFGARALNPVGAHLLLVEEQALLDDPAAELAGMVMPMRDPPVGGMRTGWRTREFDPWIAPGPPRTSFDRMFVERRLGEEWIVLPLAALRWTWMQRIGGPDAPFHPRFGPAGDPPTRGSVAVSTRLSR
ncbi:MAG: ABC transporter substrate-binding protein [Candidatus Eisenbacteria bacterium]